MVSSRDVLCLAIIVLTITGLVLSSTSDGINCRKCKHGFYVKEACTTDHDTVCTQCPAGRFMSLEDNLEAECNICSVCPAGSYVSVQCTTTTDTLCQSCDHVVDTEIYRSICKGQKVPQLDLSLGSGSLKLDNIEETGSGTEEVDVVVHPNVTVINDDYIITDNETEGSGDVILVIPPVDEIIPEDKTASVLPVLQNDTVVKDEDLIPVSPPVPTKKTKVTTVASETPSTSHTVQTTTAALRIDLDPGIKLDDDKGDDQMSNDKVEEITIAVPVERKSATPKTEKNDIPTRSLASERKIASMTDDSDKVSIGIVIAVAIIAAIVFFVIGFIVSKYCRRRRQEFKMMNKIEKNGGPHNGSIPVMLDVNNSYRQNGIYDEIGKEANGKCSISKLDEIVPVHEDNVYAVPDKKKKNEPEIKYIDETTDDEFDNKEDQTLLEKPEAVNNDNEITSPKHSTVIEHNTDESVEDINEASPMMSEIRSEIENNIENSTENDSLVEKS